MRTLWRWPPNAFVGIDTELVRFDKPSVGGPYRGKEAPEPLQELDEGGGGAELRRQGCKIPELAAVQGVVGFWLPVGPLRDAAQVSGDGIVRVLQHKAPVPPPSIVAAIE